MTTYDENGGYPHPDHIMCHGSAWPPSTRRPTRSAYPELGEPWQALKLYYHFTFHRQRIVALDQAMIERGLESPYAERLQDWTADPEHAARHDHPGAVCGATSPSATGRCWPTRPRSTRRALVPRAAGGAPDGLADRGLQLVRSRVETELPEDDLFAGVSRRRRGRGRRTRAGADMGTRGLILLDLDPNVVRPGWTASGGHRLLLA